MSDRTVLDVLADAYWRGRLSAVLGIDPDMPFDQFTRWMSYGQRADELMQQYEGPSGEERYDGGWHDCLWEIQKPDVRRGDQ